ncbi:unnamed protein product [Gadus morhua 'NCC']
MESGQFPSCEQLPAWGLEPVSLRNSHSLAVDVEPSKRPLLEGPGGPCSAVSPSGSSRDTPVAREPPRIRLKETHNRAGRGGRNPPRLYERGHCGEMRLSVTQRAQAVTCGRA